MLNILSHTPSWVYILFVGLLALGLLQTRDRIVKKSVAFLLPVAMFSFSFFGLQSTFGLNALPVVAWLMGLSLVALVARQAFLRTTLSFDSQRNRFFIPGSWVPLTVIMAIFFAKYALAVNQARTGENFETGFTLGLGLLQGACSGYFAARSLALMHVAKSINDSSKASN